MNIYPGLYRFFNAARQIYWRLMRPIELGVRVILVRDDRVLLIRHTYQPGWFLVGGGVKRGETIEQAARREAHEEVGATLEAIEFRGMFLNLVHAKSDHIAVFACRDFTFTGVTDHEIAEHRLFSNSSLPEDMPPGHRRRIQEFTAGDHFPSTGTW
jgi:8-oxo-dGTP pyrophosphatase MutT (NUDIX family)